MSDFGNLLRQLRDGHDPQITQAQIGEAAGVTPATVCDWENDRRAAPAHSDQLTTVTNLFPPEDAKNLFVTAAMDRGFVSVDIADKETAALYYRVCEALRTDEGARAKILGALDGKKSGRRRKQRS